MEVQGREKSDEVFYNKMHKKECTHPMNTMIFIKILNLIYAVSKGSRVITFVSV